MSKVYILIKSVLLGIVIYLTFIGASLMFYRAVGGTTTLRLILQLTRVPLIYLPMFSGLALFLVLWEEIK